MMPFKTILHPTDFSEQSKNALDLACALANGVDGARLILAHFVTPPVAPPGPPHAAVLERFEQQTEMQRQESEQHLEQLKPSHPNVNIECVAGTGDPTTEVVRLAEEANCDAIVLGTHGRTGLSRLFMGSVAERIIREAPCPVIAVKEPIAGE